MLRYKVRVKKGKWADSPQNPERREKRRNLREERAPKRERKVTDIGGVLRRSMAEELGEDEVSKDARFAMLQKYGIVAPKIDRKVVRPSWKSEKQFNQEQNEWFRSTKGLVPAVQEKQWERRKAATTPGGIARTKPRSGKPLTSGARQTLRNSGRNNAGRSVKNTA